MDKKEGILEFKCSRAERGVTACAKQCEQCAKEVAAIAAARDKLDAQPVPTRSAKEIAAVAADAQGPAVEQPAKGPKVKAALAVVIYEDGNVQVDGPFHDRIMFAGLIYLAQDAERRKFDEDVRRGRLQPVSAQHRTITDRVRRFLKR